MGGARIENGVIHWHSTTASDVPYPTPPPASRGTASTDLLLYVVVPVAVVCGIFLVVGMALCIHSWRGKRKYNVAALQHFYQSSNNLDDTKSSVNTSVSKTGPPKEFIPRLTTISEEPEDILKTSLKVQQHPFRLASEESVLSVLSKLQMDMAAAVATSPFLTGADTSQSYPNLAVNPQAPFSPYHLTWLSPAAGREALSDPSIGTNYVGGRNFRVDSVESATIPSSLAHPWKSPYHPNYNTPTEPGEADGQQAPPSALINRHVPAVEVAPITRSYSHDWRRRLSHQAAVRAPCPVRPLHQTSREELLLSASRLAAVASAQEAANQLQISLSNSSSMNSTYNAASCPICAASASQLVPPSGLPGHECGPRTLSDWGSLAPNVGSTETSLNARALGDLSDPRETHDGCHGSCETTRSTDQSIFVNSQNTSTFYYPGPSHSTSIGASNNASHNLTRSGGHLALSLPPSALVSRATSPTLLDETVCSAPARVCRSVHERLVTSATQTDLPFDLSELSANYESSRAKTDVAEERKNKNEHEMQASMSNISTDVHRSATLGPGREPSFEWDTYPFYQNQNSQSQPSVDSSQNSSGTTMTRPVYPVLSDVQYWV